MAGTKINEYPQAAALNDTDLLVMDQVQSGIHSTKSVSIGQITDKATSGLSGDNIPIEAGSQDSISDSIGPLSDLTTTNQDSLVDAVNEVDGKKSDKVANGTYNFSGVWSPSFYSSRSMFIPFPNANDYTVTLVRARYASDNTTMNDITSTAQIPTGGVSEVGIQVSTTSNCDLKYGDIQLKFE